MGGPVADALWEVSSSKLCVVLGGVLVKQQYHYLHWWRNNTTCIVIACSPYLYHAPRRRFGSSAAVSSSLPSHPGAALGRHGVRVTNQPTRCWVRYSSAVRELPRGQCAQCRLLW